MNHDTTSDSASWASQQIETLQKKWQDQEIALHGVCQIMRLNMKRNHDKIVIAMEKRDMVEQFIAVLESVANVLRGSAE